MTKPNSEKTSGDKPRSIPVSVRFTEPQLVAIEKQAKKLGLDVSSYVRMCALSQTDWNPD